MSRKRQRNIRMKRRSVAAKSASVMAWRMARGGRSENSAGAISLSRSVGRKAWHGTIAGDSAARRHLVSCWRIIFAAATYHRRIAATAHSGRHMGGAIK